MEPYILSWVIFCSVVLLLLALDLGIFNKADHIINARQSLLLTLFYIGVACIFGIYVYFYRGADSSRDYFTGFLIEKAMSVDNIFIISAVFGFLNIPRKYQHRVLFWGIFGVIILRAIMISAGASLVANFAWVLFIFAAILIATGVKTFYMVGRESVEIKDMYIYKILRRRFNIYPRIAGNKFFVIENNKFFITPLFMALVTIETMDIIFAIDSIPAIFAITQDTYIVYTSNIFAILGLRALFFFLSNILIQFKYLKYSLALILILIGVKIFVAHFSYIPAYSPLLVTVILLMSGILLSLILQRRKIKW